MNFQEAVREYQANPTKENLAKQTAALVGEMTLDEKIYMIAGHGVWPTIKDYIKTHRYYNVHALPAGGCKRLGVPPVLFTDGPRGVVMGKSTCFPVSMLRASAFDTDLEYRIGKAIAAEAIAQGANFFGGVCINLVRNPRWGRTQESYGEDPHVLGEFGVALTKSVQEEGMIACPKHYALNSIEDLRFYVNVKCGDRTLHEVYLPHFKKCVEAGALSVMGAYNRYDEFHCCGNKKLLTDILRNQWGFDGFVMSDFAWGVRDGEQSLRAGLDIEMLYPNFYTKRNIKKLLKGGKVHEGHIDRAVKNILGVLIRLLPKMQQRSMQVVGCPEHKALALEAAEKGMVLLKNDGLLPLAKDTAVMVTGPYADVENVGDHGSSRVYDPHVVTPFGGIKRVFSHTSLTDGEVAVVCVGSNSKKEGEYFLSTKYSLEQKPKDAGGDRASLRLEPDEVDLIKRLKAEGKKVVVVLYSGCAIITEEWKQYADAIIMNYYSGCEGGTALANLLCGNRNFSGHLPFTVALREEDYPPIIGIGQKPYEITYGYYHGYTLFDKEEKEVEYPFGFGLSYTDFAISNVEVEATAAEVKVKAMIKNTGKVEGADVVQVYAGSKGAKDGADRPVKLLKGFQRVELQAGESKTVEISIPKDDLRFWTPGGWILDDAYTVYVGDDSKKAMSCKVDVTM